MTFAVKLNPRWERRKLKFWFRLCYRRVGGKGERETRRKKTQKKLASPKQDNSLLSMTGNLTSFLGCLSSHISLCWWNSANLLIPMSKQSSLNIKIFRLLVPQTWRHEYGGENVFSCIRILFPLCKSRSNWTTAVVLVSFLISSQGFSCDY